MMHNLPLQNTSEMYVNIGDGGRSLLFPPPVTLVYMTKNATPAPAIVSRAKIGFTPFLSQMLVCCLSVKTFIGEYPPNPLALGELKPYGPPYPDKARFPYPVRGCWPNLESPIPAPDGCKDALFP